jgi:hypothetical protein
MSYESAEFKLRECGADLAAQRARLPLRELRELEGVEHESAQHRGQRAARELVDQLVECDAVAPLSWARGSP